MGQGFLDIAITPSVRAAQTDMGSEGLWENGRARRTGGRLSDTDAAFIESRDSFYIATVSQTGWPYVQHRGGPAGFLNVLDPGTLALADYRGNRQYISLGNLAANDRACLILVDYPQRARLKVYARVETVAIDDNPQLLARVHIESERTRPERIFVLRVEAFDWNCPQHITPRFTHADVADAVRPLQQRLAELESENARLRAMAGATESD
ncbi:pyridoxamine 5'-phosphate oxidase family protein [Stappia sp.]|uniref:pyridoxamine 5'-phosphate oxidase family protein n=1 Tax=Stappia sp. TaxID=1870903 RepID=UPI003A995537